jgi:DNA-binding LacI/PurR family transcriptional regulator
VTRNRVTLQTIADELGVSRTTVSNAYNRPDQLAPELRDRVLDTAARLGYRGPDAAARRLRSGGREAIGLLSTGYLSYAFTDPAAVLFMEGFARAVEEAGLGMLMIPGTGYGATRIPNAIRDAVVDGFCLHSLPKNSPDIDAAIARGVPLVFVDEPHTGKHTFIGIDDEAGARMASEHLLGLGHRHVGAVVFSTTEIPYYGPVDLERELAAVYPVSGARLRGWREPLEAAGIDRADHPREERADNTPESGAEALRILLQRDPRLTAVLFSSDQMALGGLRAARDMGRDDISIVGYDDVPPSRLAGLTTVSQPLLDKGLLAGRLLVARDTEPARDIILPVELRIRETTRPPGTAA